MKAQESPVQRSVLVTGGAGFIGSHLVDALMARDASVRVLDNLSSGSLDNLEQWLENPRLRFLRGDLTDKADVVEAVKGCGVLFHLAANPEVRLSSVEPDVQFVQNVVATYNVLEALRRSGSVESLVFTSSSTVYGDAVKIPTPEDYAPLEPVSVYGACKLASEALIISYAHTYGFRAVVFRLANIVGSRSRHGVICDFIRKLKTNTREMEILGDGTQAKSYLDVSDCVDAMLYGLEKSTGRVEVFNLGSKDWIDVKGIADIAVEEMDLKDVSFRFTGGVDGGRGWKGDVKFMLLSIDRLRSLGWEPKLCSAEAVRATARSILSEFD
ncbi:MAG: NAD-dependent epimerase/dehydratase family protein [Candidatus Bathyarchaeia archaeon]